MSVRQRTVSGWREAGFLNRDRAYGARGATLRKRPRGGWQAWHRDKTARKKCRKTAEASKRRNRGR